MKPLIQSLAACLAFAVIPAFADPAPLYSVECSITPKVKEAKVTKVTAANLDLEEHALMLPIVSPANETLIINVCLVRERSSSDRKKKPEEPSAIQVDIQDPSRVTVSGSDRVVHPLQVFSAQLPYKPGEKLPLFDNNDFTLSIQVKSSASK